MVQLPPGCIWLTIRLLNVFEIQEQNDSEGICLARNEAIFSICELSCFRV